MWHLPKGWTELVTTYPREFNGAPYQLRTPSRLGFDRRFAIVDPFQKPYLAGHVQRTLKEVAADIYEMELRGLC